MRWENPAFVRYQNERVPQRPSILSALFSFITFFTLFVSAGGVTDGQWTIIVLSFIPLLYGVYSLWRFLAPPARKKLPPSMASSPGPPPSMYAKPVFSTPSPSRARKSSAPSTHSPLSFAVSSKSATSTPTALPMSSLSTPPARLRRGFFSAGTPSPTHRKIQDSSELSQYLSDHEKHESLTQLLNSAHAAAKSGQGFTLESPSRSPSWGSYRHAPAPKKIDKKKVTFNEFSYHNAVAANKLYMKLKIVQHLDDWTNKVRLWISQMLLHPLVEHMKTIEDRIGIPLERWSVGAPQEGSTSLSSMPINFSSSSWTTKPETSKQAQFAFKNFATHFQGNQEAMNDPNKKALWQASQHLEKFLSISSGRYNSRTYIIKRIKELATGNVLANYRYKETMGDDAQKKWKAEEISDAQILLHLFCTFMDEKLLPNDPARQDQPFTSRHFLIEEPDVKPDTSKAAIIIHQTRMQPPHFNLLVEGEPWDILKGRNNLFHTLVLFIHYIKTNWNGKLHQTDLGTKPIQLLSVVH